MAEMLQSSSPVLQKKSAAPTTSLVIYAINEIDGMRALAPRIKKEWVDQILVIDGGSKDGTIEFAKECGYEVYVQKEASWNGAYKEAYEHVRGDIVIDFSPDGNSVPELIPQLIAKVNEGYDLVIASRYIGNASSEDDSTFTRVGNWTFTKLINLFFRGHFTDTLVIYRAYRMSLIKDCGLFTSPDHQFTAQLCIRSAKRHKRVAEIPGDEPRRIGGESKLRPFYNGMLILKLIVKEFFSK